MNIRSRILKLTKTNVIYITNSNNLSSNYMTSQFYKTLSMPCSLESSVSINCLLRERVEAVKGLVSISQGSLITSSTNCCKSYSVRQVSKFTHFNLPVGLSGLSSNHWMDIGESNYSKLGKEGKRMYTTSTTNKNQDDAKTSSPTINIQLHTEPPLSRIDKLKKAIAEYGSIVIIFHATISLASLGICYTLVSSGVDIGKLLDQFGINNGVIASTGTFVTAYAIHKIFSPVRISITLASTPFIARYLRKRGFLKKSQT